MTQTEHISDQVFCLEVLNDCCASVFFGKLVFRNHRPLCSVAKSGVRKTLVDKNHLREILISPWSLRESIHKYCGDWLMSLCGNQKRFLKTGSKYHSCIQEGQEERSRNLQVDQPHFYHWDVDGASNTGKCFQDHERQENFSGPVSMDLWSGNCG